VGILGVTLQTVERGDGGKNLTAMAPFASFALAYAFEV
jgi:hypothetical protein